MKNKLSIFALLISLNSLGQAVDKDLALELHNSEKDLFKITAFKMVKQT